MAGVPAEAKKVKPPRGDGPSSERADDALAPLGFLRRKTVHESVLEALRTAILGHELSGGTRLVVASLAEQFGVSITPVREAMRELATQGLIRFEPYKGAVVHTPTLDEVREVYEARLLIEPVVVRKAVERITAADLEAAQRMQQEMTSTADVARWVVLNRRFHGIFVASARSPRLANILEGLEDAAAPQVALSIRADYRRVTDGNVEHQEFLDAFRERDADRAVLLLVHHLESTVRAVESLAQRGVEEAAEGGVLQGAFDFVVKGGVVVGPTGRGQLDVYVRDGKVAALVPPNREMGASRAVDADGLLVLPGMVDTHVHLMDPGDTTREDFPTGTLAAVCSGVTTIIEHTHGWPVTGPDRLAEKRAHLRGRSYVDYGLAAHIWDDPGQDLRGLWSQGVSFFKIFTCATHGVPAQAHDRLAEVFDLLADLGAPALVHCEDDQITSALERRLHEAGRNDPGILPAWRSLPAELVAVGAVALLARLSGAQVTIAHVSSAPVLEVLRAEQLRGSPAVAESCLQYLFLHEDEVYEHGALRKFTPPARVRCTDDAEQMWRALNSGAIHLLSSDHAPSTREQKLAGDFWHAPFGLPGLDTTFRLMLDAALSGRTSLERLVEVYARAPARRYGLEGKGRLMAGSDADLVLVDPTTQSTITDEGVRSKAGWTPYAGRSVRGSVVSVMLRGAIVVENGKVVVAPSGQYMAGPGAKSSGLP